MKMTLFRYANCMKFLLGISYLFLSSCLVYSQNFSLIGQKPTHEIKAYESAHNYISSKQEVSRYTLGTNDVLTITVMRHPEVSGKYVTVKLVRP